MNYLEEVERILNADYSGDGLEGGHGGFESSGEANVAPAANSSMLESLKAFFRQFVDDHFANSIVVPAERKELADQIAKQIVAANPGRRKETAEKIIKRLGFSGLREALQKLLEAGCVGIAAYVTRLYYQLAIAATEKFGREFGIKAFEEAAWLQQLIGVCTFIAITNVYAHCCHDTATKEYAALKNLCGGAKPTAKGIFARLSAIIPGAAVAVISKKILGNSVGYSAAVFVVLFAMLGVGMKSLFELPVTMAMGVLALGLPAAGYGGSLLELEPFSNELANYVVFGSLAVFAGGVFAGFAGMNTPAMLRQMRADFKEKSVLKIAQWPLLIFMGLAAGFATSEVWAQFMVNIKCNDCIARPITMACGLLAGIQFNVVALRKTTGGAWDYIKHTLWSAKTGGQNLLHRYYYGKAMLDRVNEILKQVGMTTPLIGASTLPPSSPQEGASPSRRAPGLQDGEPNPKSKSARRLSFGSSSSSLHV